MNREERHRWLESVKPDHGIVTNEEIETMEKGSAPARKRQETHPD
jgi:hypothetical protein